MSTTEFVAMITLYGISAMLSWRITIFAMAMTVFLHWMGSK